MFQFDGEGKFDAEKTNEFIKAHLTSEPAIAFMETVSSECIKGQFIRGTQFTTTINNNLLEQSRNVVNTKKYLILYTLVNQSLALSE